MSQRNTHFNYTGEPVVNRVGADSSTSRITKANISTSTQIEGQDKRVINGMEFVSVKNEIERFYDVPNKERKGETIRVVIKAPQWLFVRPSGSHEVIASDGFTHYIPNSFVHLAWKQKEGSDEAEF